MFSQLKYMSACCGLKIGEGHYQSHVFLRSQVQLGEGDQRSASSILGGCECK